MADSSVQGWVYVVCVNSQQLRGRPKKRVILKVGKASFVNQNSTFVRLHHEKKALQALGFDFTVDTTTGNKTPALLQSFFWKQGKDGTSESDLIALIAVPKGNPEDLPIIEAKVRKALGTALTPDKAHRLARKTHKKQFGFDINDLALGILLNQTGPTDELVLSTNSIAYNLWGSFSAHVSDATKITNYTYAHFKNNGNGASAFAIGDQVSCLFAVKGKRKAFKGVVKSFRDDIPLVKWEEAHGCPSEKTPVASALLTKIEQ